MADGSERFDGPGEVMLTASVSGVIVGVGGISACPDVAGALRVRRFYVSSAHRRRGIARLLAEPVIAHGLRHTAVITCNARASDAAPPFWAALGFRPVVIDGITHQLDLRHRAHHSGRGTSPVTDR